MTDILADFDSDSLFGSPPPSPRLPEGRSTSLALPCGPHDASARYENVGTIALPGSHNSSEPVINLPASPPRQHAAVAAVSSRVQTQPRQSTPNVMAPQPTITRKKKRRKTAASAPPVIPPPSLTLPTSDQPPPSNFFRNQQALLGHVGVIAGLNPANLLNRSSRGDSQNPIVVDEDVPTALAAWKATSRLRPPLPNDAEPSAQQLPPPHPSLDASMQEKLVRHGAACDVGCCAGDHSLHSQALRVVEKSASLPPAKRRRVDPYYPSINVEERSTAQSLSSADLLPPKKGKGKTKKMLLHVLSMLKDALEQGSKEDENSNVGDGSGRSHYRPRTARYGIDVQPSEAGESASSADIASVDFPLPQFNLDDPVQLLDRFALSDDYGSYDSSTGSPAPFIPSIPEQFSQSDLESWLSAVSDQLRDPDPSFGNDFGALSLFNSLDVSPTPPSDPAQLPASLDVSAITTSDAAEQSNGLCLFPLPTQNDLQGNATFDSMFPIDPSLLAVPFDNGESSQPGPNIYQNSDGRVVDNVDLANGASGLNFGTGSWVSPSVDEDLASLLGIPASVGHGSLPESLSIPQVDTATTLFDPPLENNLLVDSTLDPLALDQIPCQSNAPDSSQFQDSTSPLPDLTSTTTTLPLPQIQPLPPTTPAKEPPLNVSTGTAPTTQFGFTAYDADCQDNRHSNRSNKQASIASTTADHSRARKAVDKEAILDIARDRRKELATELARAKIELWETTIEQGVLLNLLKEKELDHVMTG